MLFNAISFKSVDQKIFDPECNPISVKVEIWVENNSDEGLEGHEEAQNRKKMPQKRKMPQKKAAPIKQTAPIISNEWKTVDTINLSFTKASETLIFPEFGYTSKVKFTF